jgi:hypothetical protein
VLSERDLEKTRALCRRDAAMVLVKEIWRLEKIARAWKSQQLRWPTSREAI